MSIGNSIDSGNQGNNFPWQFKMLQGLQQLADSNSNILADLSVLINNTNQKIKHPSIERRSGITVTIDIELNSISFASVGTANATVNGIVLKPGEIINFDAGVLNNTFDKNTFSYDTTTAGAELLITYIRP